MPKKSLTIINSGSTLRWEDTAAYLGLCTNQRHNLDDSDADHYFFITDGVAHPTGRDHPDTATASFVAPSKGHDKGHRYLQKAKRTVFGSGLCDLVIGWGLRHQAKINVDIYKHLDKTLAADGTAGITQLTLIGFSRGGAAAIEAACALSGEADLSITLMPLDPVPGYFRSLGSTIDIPANVTYFVSTLSVHETALGGLEYPIGPKQLRFNPETMRRFIPLPGDHLNCLLASKDIVRRTLSKDHPLYHGDADAALFTLKYKRTRGHYDDKGSLINLKTMTALRLFHNNSARYSTSYFAHGSNSEAQAKKITAIENYFKAFDTPPASLMADTDPLIAAAQSVGRTSGMGKRSIHHTLFPKGKRQTVFFNAVHMTLFQQTFPACFKHLNSSNTESKLDPAELKRMGPSTRKNIEHYTAMRDSGKPTKLSPADSLHGNKALADPLFFVHPTHNEAKPDEAAAPEHK